MFKKISLVVVSSLLLVFLAAPAFAITPSITRVLKPTPKVTGQVKGIYTDPGDGSSLLSSSGNVYIANNNVVVTDDVHGDLVVAGGTVVVKGRISGNVYAAGGGVEIDNDVNGDLTVFAGTLIVNGTIRGDVRVAGGEVYINAPHIGGDLLVAAGKTSIADGVKVAGLDRIAGEANNSMMVTRNASNNPTLLSQTNAVRTTPVAASPVTTAIGIILGAIFSLLIFFGGVVAAYLVLRLFPIFSEATLLEMRKSPLKSMLVGFLSSFVIGLAMLILAFSVIGWQVLALTILLGIIAVYIAGFYAKYTIGRFILLEFKHTHTGRFFPLVLGMVLVSFVMWLLDFVPILGALINSLIGIALVSWGTGAMLTNKYQALKKH